MCQTLLLFILTGICTFSVGHSREFHFIDQHKKCSEALQYCRDHHTDMVTEDDLPDGWPKTKGFDDVWVRGANEYLEGKDWEWVDSNTNTNNVPGTCAFVQKKPGEPLSWHNASCSEIKRYACYDSSKKKYCYHSDETTWNDAVKLCTKTSTTLLVSGCDQVEHHTFVNKIQEKGENVQWWVGLYNDNKNSSFPDSICCEETDTPDVQRTDLHPFICYDDHMVLVKENMTWEEALVYCRRNNSELAIMTNEHQDDMVAKKSKMADTEFVWVGLHFSCFFEEWMWVNGYWVASDDQRWKKKNELPNCDVSGAMERNGKNKWVKKYSGDRYNFVCAFYC